MEKLSSYLIRIPHHDSDTEINARVIPCADMNEVMEYVRRHKTIITVFKRAGATGLFWEYHCDISNGVI